MKDILKYFLSFTRCDEKDGRGMSVVISLMINPDRFLSNVFFVWEFFGWPKISEHPDIPAITHSGLSDLRINSSKSLAIWYTIDKYDIKPAVMKGEGGGGEEVSISDVTHNQYNSFYSKLFSTW